MLPDPVLLCYVMLCYYSCRMEYSEWDKVDGLNSLPSSMYVIDGVVPDLKASNDFELNQMDYCNERLCRIKSTNVVSIQKNNNNNNSSDTKNKNNVNSGVESISINNRYNNFCINDGNLLVTSIFPDLTQLTSLNTSRFTSL